MIYFKPNVRIKVFTPAIRFILFTLYDLNAKKLDAYPIDWWVTSINDSTHLPNSKHYLDQAIDLRSKNFADEMSKKIFLAELKDKLGSKFTVLYENAGEPQEHFHIQVKKGISFP